MTSTRLMTILTTGLAATFCAEASAQWTQWGGAKQECKVNVRGLANEWPTSGPPVIWSRDLGEGYSSVLCSGERLYTMYRKGDEDHVAAMSSKDGKTAWDFAYESKPHEKHIKEFNSAPRATPVLDDGRIYAVSCQGIMHCLDAKTGEKIWRKDLWTAYEPATFLNHGYSASPYIYKDTVIMIVGGKGQAVVAFDKKTGAEKWKSLDFDASYATPKLIDVDGQKQLLCFMAHELIAINPEDGKLHWSFEHGNSYGQNISMPLFGDDNIIFISSVDTGGSRGLKLSRKDDKTEVEELWHNKRVKIHHQNAVRVGDTVYASTGGPGIFQAIDVHTGDILWRERGFATSNVLYADGEFIIVDEEGHLGLATGCPEFFQIHAKVSLLGARSWTVPTLVEKTLYLRDSRKLLAVDLGAKS